MHMGAADGDARAQALFYLAEVRILRPLQAGKAVFVRRLQGKILADLFHFV